MNKLSPSYMWIKRSCNQLSWFWQNTGYKRLAFGLALSLLIHLLLITNNGFHLSPIDAPRQMIEAQLIFPKPLPPPIKPKALHKPVPVRKLPTAEKFLAKPLNEPTQITQEKPSETSNEAPVAENPPPQQTAAEASAPVIEPSVEAAPDTQVNEEVVTSDIAQAYHYVAAMFDVYVDKEEVSNRAVAGQASMVYQQKPNTAQYQITSLLQAKGLISLVVPDLLQTSEGDISATGLQPLHYLYEFGHKKDKTYRADFDWQAKKLTLHSSKGEQVLDLKDGTQDLLSFMYQFMFMPPLQNMQLSITNGKKLGIYDYIFEGQETLKTKIGEISTIHIARGAVAGEKKTELWLALDYQHVPVKIRETSADGKIYELVIKSLDARLAL